MRALSIAATGMLAQQTNVDVISNNIANMNTTAFKRQRAEFQDLLYQQVARPGAETGTGGTRVPTGIQIGTGVRTGDIYRISDQGEMAPTGNPYDLAVSGLGYFQITLPNGDFAYTRASSFQLSDQGELVTTDGYRVNPGITIPQGVEKVSVSKAGQVQVKMPGQAEMQNVGRLQLATFVNEAGLEALGSSLFRQTEASGQPTIGSPDDIGFGKIEQGFVESSNVNPVSEITSLIAAQRAYEMNSRVVKTADEMLSTTTQLR